MAGMIFLFVMCNTKIHYSDEKLTLKYPLRTAKEVYWRNIQRIEVITARKRGIETWKKLRIYAGEGTYRVHMEFLNHGKNDFITELEKMMERYEIPFTESGK